MNSSVVVIDACTVLAWGLGEPVHASKVQVVRDFLAEGSAVVPPIFIVEIAGVLAHAERQGRITPAETRAFVDELMSLPIEIDEELSTYTSEYMLRHIMELCRLYNLKSKDACYLELASRRSVRLATFDAALDAAARESGVSFFS